MPPPSLHPPFLSQKQPLFPAMPSSSLYTNEHMCNLGKYRGKHTIGMLPLFAYFP